MLAWRDAKPVKTERKGRRLKEAERMRIEEAREGKKG